MLKRKGQTSEHESRYATPGSSFDDPAKALASGTFSRGTALRLLGAALFGGAAASIPGAAWAKNKPGKPVKKCTQIEDCPGYFGPHACCNGRCCAEAENCVNGECGCGTGPSCPKGTQCVPGTGTCCPQDQFCPTDFSTTNAICCPEGTVCTGFCSSFEQTCVTECCPVERACGPYCCPVGTVCQSSDGSIGCV